MALKKSYLVEKRNMLNELRSKGMTLQEMRFFCIYLSKINARDAGTRVVRFPLSEFQGIMELSQVNVTQLGATMDSLLQKIVHVPSESGRGLVAFQLFRECRLDQDGAGDWYVEIDAHDRALPLMFEFKSQYFTYGVGNVLRLRSSAQVRMYEILKQHQRMGERTVGLDDLKAMLGIGADEYPRYDNFKSRVLEPCRKALEELTDISYAYEPVKRGRGGKVTAVKFRISGNGGGGDGIASVTASVADAAGAGSHGVLRLQGHEGGSDGLGESWESPYRERIRLLSDALQDEFSREEVELLNDILLNLGIADEMEAHGYLLSKYRELRVDEKKTKIRHRFGYLKKLVESGLE
jgi:hypothetical protein